MKNLFINAGPGTGKTEFMKNAFEESLRGGLSPSEILGFSFTRAAAENMKERLCDYSDLQISTLHAFCFNNLVDVPFLINDDLLYDIASLFVPRALGKGGSEYCQPVVSDVLKCMDGWCIYNFIRYEDATYNDYISSCCSTEHLQDFISIILDGKDGKKKDESFYYVCYSAVIKTLKSIVKLGYTSFFDILVRGYYQIRMPHIKYILIDEFQDLTYIQYKLATAISPNANYLLLSDVNQSIYGWNHSSFFRNLRDFKMTHELEEIKLGKNYRCSSEVQFLANLLTGRNDVSEVQTKGEVGVIERIDKEGLGVAEVVRFALELQEEGGTVAILTNTGAIANIIVNQFKLQGQTVCHRLKSDYYTYDMCRLFIKLLDAKLKPFNTTSLLSLCADRDLRKAGTSLIDYLKFFKKNVTAEYLLRGRSSFLVNGHSKDTTFVVFDTETTGTNTEVDDIVQLAAIKVDACFNEIERFNRYLYTDRDLSVSEQVHGISREYLDEHGEDPVKVLKDFEAFSRGSQVVAHNCYFDKSIIERSCKEYNISFNMTHWIDTLDIARIILKPYGLENYKLGTIVAHFDLPATPNHNAMFDVEATVLLLPLLRDKFQEQGLAEKIEANPTYNIIQEQIKAIDLGKMTSLNKLMAFIDEITKTKECTESEEVYIDSFMEIVKELIHKGTSLSGILNFFIEKEPPVLSNKQQITVCTVHQSKGLEFDHVIYYQERNSKHTEVINDHTNVENVAVSRAKNSFYLYLGKRVYKSRLKDFIDYINGDETKLYDCDRLRFEEGFLDKQMQKECGDVAGF